MSADLPEDILAKAHNLLVDHIRLEDDTETAFDTARDAIGTALLAERAAGLEQTDDYFTRHYPVAKAKGDYYAIAHLLSGRLREMDKRARAANRRADRLHALYKGLKMRLLYTWIFARDCKPDHREKDFYSAQ